MFSRTSVESYRWVTSLFLSLTLVASALLLLEKGTNTGFAQDRGELNRLAQTSTDPGREMKAFRDGRDALGDERWARAAERFDDYITDYPHSKNVDAALYWLAFALTKQDKFREADKVLERLLRGFPTSSWTEDARTMRVEIAPRLGNGAIISEEASGVDNEESKLIALRSLFTTNPEQAMTLAANVFEPNSKADKSFKESVITLVGRYGGRMSTPMLSDIARRESEDRLSKAAIFWLGKSVDDNALEVLKDIAQKSENAEVASAAVTAILQQGSQQAIGFLGEIAHNAKSLEARQQASSLLGVKANQNRTNMKGVWLLIRESNRLLIIPTERVLKLVGAGNLKFKRDGRLIEVPQGSTITINGESIFRERDVRKGETAEIVNGEAVYRERVVRENEIVRIIGENNKTQWELSLDPADHTSSFNSGDWLTINGEFTLDTDAPKTFLLHIKPGGGLRIRR